jgi:DNA-binding IclR family transcriptional regulator
MEKKKTIQSIDKAAKILNFIAKSGNEARLTEISNELDIKKSTLSGLLSTLEYNELVYQNPETLRYSLGIKLYEYGKIYEEHFSLKNIVRPYLEKLSKEFGEGVYLAIESDYHVLYVDRIEANHSLRLATKPGHTDPMYCNAMGKVILAFQSQDYFDNYLNNSERVKLTETTLTTKEELTNEIKQIRELGYALDNEEIEKGLICVAAPIFGENNSLVAVIAVSGPINRIDSKILNKLKITIPEIAAQISNIIKY